MKMYILQKQLLHLFNIPPSFFSICLHNYNVERSIFMHGVE
jgi:hypothetical protein